MKYITLLLLFGILSVSCGNRTSVQDVQKPEALTLESSVKQPSSIEIVGDGVIDGEATIILMMDGEPYRTEELSGDVDFRWGGDWYSDKAEIRYDPISVAGGHLDLKFKF